MKHIFWVIPNRLAGRPGPIFEPWSLSDLYGSGFRTIINLTEAQPNISEFRQNGLDVGWFPIPDDCPANSGTEIKCNRAIPKAYNFLISKLNLGHKVLVHCEIGCDRTGFLCAYYFALNFNKSPVEAIKSIRAVRPQALSAQGWEPMAIRVIEKSTSI
jgi:protein-tyrosine phosphatase